MLYLAIAAVLAFSACAGDAAGAPGVPFRLETGMPHEPPAVYITDGRVRIAGTRYTADWVRRLRTVVQRPSTPVPWPSEAARLSTDGRISVVFATPIAPDHVVLQAYGQVDARGEPVGEAASASEYDATTTFAHVGTETHLEDVSVARTARYIVVFAIWHVPLADQADAGPANASASWLFVLGRSSPALQS